MAIIDKKGVLHGAVSNIVYRSYRNLQIAQIKPEKVRQTLKSKPHILAKPPNFGPF